MEHMVTEDTEAADPDAVMDCDTGLLDLAQVRLYDLLADRCDAVAASTLEYVMRRLFDPDDRERPTVSAFASSL